MPLPGEFLRARHVRETHTPHVEQSLEKLASTLHQHLLESRKIIEIIGIWQDEKSNMVSVTGVCTPETTVDDLRFIGWNTGCYKKSLITEDSTFYLSISVDRKN